MASEVALFEILVCRRSRVVVTKISASRPFARRRRAREGREPRVECCRGPLCSPHGAAARGCRERMTRKVCSICGTPHVNRGARCDVHKIPARTGTYSRNAAKVRASALTCHICGKGFTDPNDPPVADHIVTRGLGGSDDPANLASAHRSCNGRKGASSATSAGSTPRGTVATVGSKDAPATRATRWEKNRVSKSRVREPRGV